MFEEFWAAYSERCPRKVDRAKFLPERPASLALRAQENGRPSADGHHGAVLADAQYALLNALVSTPIFANVWPMCPGKNRAGVGSDPSHSLLGRFGFKCSVVPSRTTFSTNRQANMV